MREILFRGKRTDNGEWVEGYLYEHEPPLQCIVSKDYIPEPSRWYIIKTAFADWNMPRQVEFIEIDPDTVCQFTGLLDKSGKRIFEGDVLRWVGPDGEVGKVYVVFAGGVFALQSVECPLADPDLFADFEIGEQTLEVIGNIHDNQELLGGGGADG